VGIAGAVWASLSGESQRITDLTLKQFELKVHLLTEEHSWSAIRSARGFAADSTDHSLRHVMRFLGLDSL
jgi:hypothetical protein